MRLAKPEACLDLTNNPMMNRWWRLCNLYHIQLKEPNEEGKLVIRFRPNWAQRMLYKGLWFCNLILKARQLGVTTFICIYFLDQCLNNPNTHAGIIAHNREDAEDFFHNKVKFALDNLPPEIAPMYPSVMDSARQLRFANGSSIKVGTSMRSGTLHYLHVSEFGKICAKYPDKAREIVTGSLNTVQAGQSVFIESTAEGRHGYFFDYCKRARDKEQLGARLTELDFRFFFFPWWKHPDYVLDPEGVTITREDEEYFQGLEMSEGIVLSHEQKAWYVKKRDTQEEDMLREYPSTPDEAFQASIQGAYYAKQMAKVRKDKRIRTVPYEPTVPVNVAWDLGIDDEMVLWFHQRVGIENRLIDFYQHNGEGLAHYVKVMQEKGYIYGEHYLPHDAEVRELGSGKSRVETLESMGVRRITVIANDISVADGIEAVRNFLNSCWFDEVNCAQGIAALDAYQKEWDDRHGTFKTQPLHNWASHAADAFRMLAIGFSPRPVVQGKKSNRRRDGRVV